jgi:hypothetical protein
VIPNSVTNIVDYSFAGCTSLTNVSLGSGAAYIGANAFQATGLINAAIPDGVTQIGGSAFSGCSQLIGVTISSTVRNIGDEAFAYCTNLSKVYFSGNPPFVGSSTFASDPATAYYLPGTTGWAATFGGLPTAPWYLAYPLILKSSVGSVMQPKQFAFTVSWATNLDVAVEANTNLFKPAWQPLQTNALINGSFYFEDPQWTNYRSRFYRVRSL